MDFYGSEMWYKARSNSVKQAIIVPTSTIDEFVNLLEANDICYYGFNNGSVAKVSVERSDIELIKSLIGEARTKELKILDIDKKYEPNDRNIFGTVEYKYIAKKTRQFLTAENAEEQKALLRTAELLQREGVRFSGRVYPNKTTLTFSENDKQRVDELYARVLEKRKSIDFSTLPIEKDVRAKPKISEEDINRANLVNLPQFLMSHGLDLKKVGKEYIWEEHDSLHIKDNQFGERGQWFRFSEDKGGNNIQFLNEYMGMTFVEAVEALNHEQYSHEYTYSRQHNTNSTHEQETAKEFSVLEDDNAKRVIAYLCKTRGLEYNMVADLIRQGIISQEQKTGNVLFKYFDEHGKVIGAEKVGTSTEQKYKGIATGSASGRGFEVVRGTGESVYFFESAIDMLSYLQTNSEQLNNCRLVSMMGVKPNTVLEIMQRHNIAPENVYLCSDNDKAGNDFAQKLQSQYPDMKRISTPDTYKDWNDMLRGIPKTGDMEDRYTENQLVKITTQIRQKQAAFTDLVNAGDFDNAAVVSQELSQLTEQARTLKATIQKEEITQKDVAALRDIEPKRKSVQNMTEPEVAQTPKFEKLLGEELGEKSPYEMRNGNLAWREDETAKVSVIEVETRDVSDIMGDMKKGLLPRGNFVNDDTNLIINVGQVGIRDTLAHSIYDSKRGENTNGRLSSLYQLKAIVKSAICFDTVISEIGKNKTPNTLFMHKLYTVVNYENNSYLAQISVEESYSTNKDGSMRDTANRFYNLKDIKIAPIRLNVGFQSHGIPSEDDRAKPYGAITELTIPQLYNLVKEYDKNFYENEQAPGRVEREAEIAAQQEFEQSVKKLEEHNGEIQNETPPTSVISDTNNVVDNAVSVTDLNELDEPDYFEQVHIAQQEQQEIYETAADFERYAVEQLVNNSTVSNAHKNSDKQAYELDVQTELDKLITELTTENIALPNSPKTETVDFINEYHQNEELRKSIFNTVSTDVDTALTVLENTRKIAKDINLPFVDKFFEGDEDDLDPHVYDGSISPEDFEKYQEQYFAEQQDIEKGKPTSVPLDTKLEKVQPKGSYQVVTFDEDSGKAEKELQQAETKKNRQQKLAAVDVWSDFEFFEYDRTVFSLAELDKLMKLYDSEIVQRKKEFAQIGDYYPNFAMEFAINLPNGQRIEENCQLGNGVGGLIEHLKAQGNKYLDVLPTIEKQLASEQDKNRTKKQAEEDKKRQGKLSQYSLFDYKPQERAEKPPFQGDEPIVHTTETPQSAANPQAEEKENIERSEPKNNYHITDEHIGEGTKSQRFQNNIAAIRTLKKIENENRFATPDEQEILAKYVGWGGLADCFIDKHIANAELRNRLTDEEYAAARESTLTAFYTPPVVMQAMYKKLSDMGFDGGKILEPSCGVGNFLGTMPEEMMSKSDVHAVELDSISGRIAQQLYQTAHIQVKGFEKTHFNDDVFDVAIGNVPFGDISVRDKDYDKYNWRIHNYFFGKSLDKVRPGGVVAFLTSRYTLDSKNSAFRQYLAERADLLGAVRLPTGTFSKAAGTEVVSDIIFLQKRDGIQKPDVIPDWVQTSQTEDGFTLNNYFVNNPEMLLGETAIGKGLYGRPEMVVKADENTPLSEQLEKAMSKINGTITERSEEHEGEIEFEVENTAPENLRNYSFYINPDDSKIYFKRDDIGSLWKKSNSTVAERAEAFIKLRDYTRAILQAMVNNCSDEQLTSMQNRLNTLYDNFYNKYGLLHSRYNRSLFKDDVSFQLVAALESKYKDDKLVAKSDLFTKRTVRPPVRVTSVDTAQEALTLSMAERGKVDFDFMQELYEVDKQTIIDELKGSIFPVPELSTDDNIVYKEASEYLSGDIREKLKFAESAAENNPVLYGANIAALKDVLPEPLKAGDIDVKIGAAWIDPKFYEQFMYEVFQTPYSYQREHSNSSYNAMLLSYSEITNSYNISHKNNADSVFVNQTYGMDIRGANAYNIFENLLNFRDTKIYKTVKDSDGKEKRVLDPEKTKLAANKAEKIKAAFKDWIFKDPERREYLVNKYNEMYNSIRPREYSGSALTFPGMNVEITLKEHQKDAIAHALYGGSTLFDHSVGAGKTFEMIASIMERKRLGISNKALMVVPNHLTEQIGDDFQKLYPNANILVATKSDFTKENRRALMAKIATGDYDAVVIGHSQLGRIPLSKETQTRYIEEEVEQLTAAIKEMKEADGQSFGVKEAEKRKKSLKQRLEKLETEKDDVVSFEELGIDMLVVDEAHEFKNLHTPTNMQNVSGVGHSASQKASDLYMKCQYLNEKTGNRGVIFATGTPVSNSVTELFTMQRYLQNNLLRAKRLAHFDQWIGLFGEKVSDYQLDPTGKKFKLKTRIAKYSNMTELMSMFKSVADIKTAEMMKLDVPECETVVVSVEPTKLQKELVEELAIRADKVESGAVDPTKDNFLKITSDGRKVGLDPRLIDPDLEDNPNTKVNKCVENVIQIYKETDEDKLTQLIFCDLGVPKGQSQKNDKAETTDEEKSVAEQESFEESGEFCIYDDIKKKLIAAGVPSNEIAYIHDAKTEEQKSKLFEKVRTGEIRVLLGSTPKMGTGTNIQDLLYAEHNIDIPWRPADEAQRQGRIERQGNRNKKVKVFRYVTKGTFDAYSYQMLENKQRFISQLYTSNTRTCEDVDQQSLTYAEIKTLCTGDERLKEVLQLDNEISTLSALKRDHINTVYEMQDKLKTFESRKPKLEKGIAGVKKDLELCSQLPRDKETGNISFKIKIDGITYTDKTEAAKQLERVFKRAEGELVQGKHVKLAEMHGFDVTVHFSPQWEDFRAVVSGNASYSMNFTQASHPTNIKRLCNIFDGMEQNLQSRQDTLARMEAEAKEAKQIAETPFTREQELADKIERRDSLKATLRTEQAMNAAKNKNKEQTYHFSVAELKRNARKTAQDNPDSGKRGAVGIE